MKRLTPNMAVADVAKSVHYYVENFGFEIMMVVSDDKSSIGDKLEERKTYIWANLMHGEVGLMLQQAESIKEDVGDFFARVGSSMTLYIEVEDVDKLYESIKEKVEIYKDIDTTWYGMREFYVRDVDGYILAFATKVQ